MEQSFFCRFIFLHKLSNILNNNSIGLYDIDGPGIFNKLSGPQMKQRKKKVIQRLRTINNDNIKCYICGVTSVDFLNITRFENWVLPTSQKTKQRHNIFRSNLYIDTNSNHPPQILKQLPKYIRIYLMNAKQYTKNPWINMVSTKA